MPSIHPSENPQLGWLVPCLTVADIEASLAFYRALGFVLLGGAPADGWAVLRNGASELHLFQGHIPRDMLNFRGGDADGIHTHVAACGLPLTQSMGPNSFFLEDPDGREVFFDIGPEETAAFQTGQPLTLPLPEGSGLHDSDLDLGNFTWCFACEDLGATAAFYGHLGFAIVGGQPEDGWAILSRADHLPVFGTRMKVLSLSLFQGMIPRDTLNFRGGDVSAIARELAAAGIDLGDGVQTGDGGGEHMLITDPDGHPVLFDTTPPERLYAAG